MAKGLARKGGAFSLAIAPFGATLPDPG
jgi:hypothetical protein